MFSGIVSHIGKVAAIETSREDWRITIETDMEASRCALGASIACNGICLTVAQLEPSQDEKSSNGKSSHEKSRFVVQAGATTRERTTLSHLPQWSVGRLVNLECSLRLGDPLDGHLVAGHVDACVSVAQRIERENEIGFDFLFPASLSDAAKQLRACCAERGSVALDGVSLTISACGDKAFSVAVIPYTAEHTTLGALDEGEHVNLEVDILARYVARRLALAGDER